MGRIKDLTGQKFGKLIVLEITPERRNRQVVWKCLCECGNITYVVGQALRTGHTKSCGCSQIEKRAQDLSGKQFGQLTVIDRYFEKKTNNRAALWNCKCSCGNYRVVAATDLRNGLVTKCVECNQKSRVYSKGMLGPIKDHTGERFGKLIAISPTKKRSAGNVVWLCKCDCGNYCEVSSNSLVSGNTHSCGCLIKHSVGEQQIEKVLKENNILFRKQITFTDVKDRIALRYDFGILGANGEIIRLIEFDGEQHFKPIEYFGGEEGLRETQRKDFIKNQKALELGIPLVRLPYQKRNSIILNDLIGDEYLVKF